MSVGIVNIGEMVACADRSADAVLCEGGKLAWLGPSAQLTDHDVTVLIDAGGACLIPGLIDSHVHVTFGDYTPRQKTVGFLESYVHGGTTRVLSASEVHVPGRPRDPAGVKALALAAQRCFAEYRPGGMAVHGGSVILEPGLSFADFAALAESGVCLAKAGFGAVSNAREYVPLVRAARDAGLIVMCHTGGGSIAGTQAKIDADALLAMSPDVAGHVNGGPTALRQDENERLVAEGAMALQLVQAGNLRSALEIVELAIEGGQLNRVLIATDTPTGTGVIPLGMLRMMAELCSLGPLSPTDAVLAATSRVADVYRLDAGVIAVGSPADVVLLDAPLGSVADDALGALGVGDIPAVAAVVSDGALRVFPSRNTPPPKRDVRLHRRVAAEVLSIHSAVR